MADHRSSAETRSSLLQAVSELDPESWIEFMALYDPLLQAYVGDCNRRYQFGLDPHDREDVKQEVVVKLYQKLPTFEKQGRFRTWLWLITRNVAVDYVRRQRGRVKPAKAQGGAGSPARPMHVNLTPEIESTLAGAEDQPDERLIQAHNQHLLRHILEKVKVEMASVHKWDCFEMHFLQGKASLEVAKLLGLSVSAVNTNTSRVRARVREWCRHYDLDG